MATLLEQDGAPPPPTDAQLAAQAHQELVQRLDMHSLHKSYRRGGSHWRPNARRNKNVKTILGDLARREATNNNNSVQAATPATNAGDGLSTSGASTPATTNATNNGNEDVSGMGGSSVGQGLAQASRSLSKLVLEKSLRGGNSNNHNNGSGGGGPKVTYLNVESALALSCKKHYCDVTGQPAPYIDPKTRLRYHDKEVFALIREVPQGVTEQYLEARGAHTVLK